MFLDRNHENCQQCGHSYICHGLNHEFDYIITMLVKSI
jgi:hypothetical protein